MTSSFSSFSALVCLLLLLTLAGGSGALAASPLQVLVPIVPFNRPPSGKTLTGRFWKAEAKARNASRAVLLVPAPGKATDQKSFEDFAASLSSTGLDSLLVEPRTGRKLEQRGLIEDIASSVRFMKTDPRVAAAKVLIVAAGPGANAAASYVSGVRGIETIIDGVLLLGPSAEEKGIRLSDSLKSVGAVPLIIASDEKAILDRASLCPRKSSCRPMSLAEARKKGIVEFALDPHHHPHG